MEVRTSYSFDVGNVLHSVRVCALLQAIFVMLSVQVVSANWGYGRLENRQIFRQTNEHLATFVRYLMRWEPGVSMDYFS